MAAAHTPPTATHRLDVGRTEDRDRCLSLGPESSPDRDVSCRLLARRVMVADTHDRPGATVKRLEDLRPRDQVLRSFGGEPTTTMTVTAVEPARHLLRPWRFDAATGAEIDEELGWGPAHGVTGSHIVPMQPEDSKVRWRTETGSVYEIERDGAGMRWRRVEATLGSGVLRNDDWPLLEWPEIEVGWSAVLVGPPLIAGADARIVRTSRVVEVIDDVGVPRRVPKMRLGRSSVAPGLRRDGASRIASDRAAGARHVVSTGTPVTPTRRRPRRRGSPAGHRRD